MIDAESEHHINAAIDEFVTHKDAPSGQRGNRTCLVVAHRLSTVRNADLIVVMDAGQVRDSGTHDELLARCDLYRGLVHRQLGGGPPAA
jgi:ABC-type multidrug transport system fused ATPase/permease subunit